MRKPRENNDYNINKEFTDREEQRRLFWDWYNKAQANLDDFFVLSYYGIGGIGKSRLTNELCRELDAEKHRYIKFDFESAKGFSPYNILMSLKQSIRNKYPDDYKFPLFNSACIMLAKKSDANFENDELIKNIVTESPYLQNLVGAISLVPVIGGFVQIGVNFTSQLIADLGNKYNNAKYEEKYERELNNMKILEADEIMSRMPGYFASDMFENMREASEPLVIFLDTYEKYVDTDRIESNIVLDQWLREGSRSVIQRIPAVLWVIMGRDKLVWGDTGEWDSEHLVCERIGNLSETDSKNYLISAGIFDDELLSCIWELSEGVPIYLEICVDTYYLMKEKGETPSADNFKIDKNKLINRYVKYMDKENQNLAFMLVSMQSWTDEEVEFVAEQTPGLQPFNTRRYEAFVRHSFISDDEDGRRHIHNIVADALSAQIDKNFIQGINGLLFKCRVNGLKKNNGQTDYIELLKKIQEAVNALCRIDCVDLYEGMFDDFEDLMRNLTRLRKKDFNIDVLEISKRINDKCTESFAGTVFHGESLKFLGDVYYSNEFQKEALFFHIKSLEIWKRILGENHTKTLNTLNEVGKDYLDLGQYEKALDCIQKVYEVRKRILGEEHPKTLGSLNDIGVVQRFLGQKEKALETYRKVYKAQNRILGKEHPATIGTLFNIGVVYSDFVRYKEALKIAQDVYEARKRILGENHPETLKSLNRLGVEYSNLGRNEEALKAHRKVYKARREIFGEDSPTTMRSLQAVGIDYANQGRYEEALRVFQDLFKMQKRILTEGHPDILNTLGKMGNMYFELGQDEETLKVKKKIYELQKHILGESHPDTLKTKLFVDYAEHIISTNGNINPKFNY